MLDRDQRLHFRDLMRASRATALADAEGFQSIVIALERLGSFLSPGEIGLYNLQPAITILAERSPLSTSIPGEWPEYHSPFSKLYTQLRVGRNAALHEGAFARHLTDVAVNVALVVEDALMSISTTVGDYMIRGPVTAALWHPVSFVRQTMLANSFSFLPVKMDAATSESTSWSLLSDVAIAKLVRRNGSSDRKRLLTMPLIDAIRREGLELVKPLICGPEASVDHVLIKGQGLPVLVVDGRNELIGIATPFDLL